MRRTIVYQGTSNRSGLTEAEMRKWCPSAFTETPHESRSSGYKVISTREIIGNMRDAGFIPVFARQAGGDRREHGKHLVRFRHRDRLVANLDVSARVIGETYPEVTLVNSHDGSSSYTLRASLLRLVCLNGLIAGGKDFAPARIGHWGDISGKVIDASFEVIEKSMNAITAAQRWREVTVPQEMQMVMAERAHRIRFGLPEGEHPHPIAPRALLTPHRIEDRPNDLWTLFNRVQENAINGGLTGRAASGPPGHVVRRRYTTQPVTGIDNTVRFNTELWPLGEQTYRELVGA